MKLHPHPVAVGLGGVYLYIQYCNIGFGNVPGAGEGFGQHRLLKLQLPAVAYVLQRAAAASAEKTAWRNNPVRGGIGYPQDSSHQVAFLGFCYLYMYLFPGYSIGDKHSHAVHMG